MDETMKNTTTEEFEEQANMEEEVVPEQETSEDPFKEAIDAQLRKIQRQNMFIGFQTACRVVLDKVVATESKPGKRTMNDYKRLIKDLKQFCSTGLSRRINADGEAEIVEEETTTEKTVQN